MRRTLWGFLVVLFVVAGCGDDSSAVDDAGDIDPDHAGVDGDAGADADADTGADADADADADAEADGDADADADAPSVCEPTATLVFSQLHGGGRLAESVVDEAHDVLVMVPEYLGPATDRLAGVSLEPGHEAPVSLAVTGDPPPINVVAASYDVAAGRSMLLGYAMRRPGDGGLGDHMELLSLTLDGAGGATLQRFDSPAPPPAEGLMFSWLYPEGDGVHYRAFRFAQLSQRAAVSGGTATWEAEVPVAIAGMGGFDENYVAHDPTGHRLLGYGELALEGTPPDYTMYLDPVFYELSLAGGTTWGRLEGMGTGPGRQETPYGIIAAAALYDDVGRRTVVLQDHAYTDPWIGETMTTGAWAFSDAGTWTVINENLMRCCVSWWGGADDRERRRVLRVSGGGLGGYDLRPGHEGDELSLDYGLLWHAARSAAFDTTRGVVLGGAEAGLAELDVRSGAPVWRDADGAPAWPAVTLPGHSIVYDAAGDRVVLYGGAEGYSGESGAVRVLDRAAAVPAWVEAATSGAAPEPRTGHAAICDGALRTMYVVGGYRLEGGTTVRDLADVAALDLGTMTWRVVGTLPVGRSSPLLRLEGGELYVLFGVRHPAPGDPYTTENLTDGYRVSPTSGSVASLSFTGVMPTVPSAGLAGLELPSGYVVVSPEAYGVEVFAATFGGGSVAWARTTACEEPRAFGGGPGVVDPSTGRGYVLGAAVWEVREP
ncbi:MAG: hypothetical protein JXB32_15365 [Deltaproteobacteria bacterium]|nr:hypothetical protein [Deltaproteobacteria bacterium]